MAFEPLGNITFGFSDAENYRRRENKDLFNKIFLRTDELEKLNRPNTYFLVGEKGTGKTAYAVYMSNSSTEQTQSVHKFIRETDYLKFISLKNKLDLSLSEYTDIWKVIILLICCKEIYEKFGGMEYFLQYKRFENLNKAIDEYYSKAFSPEILSALQFVENSQIAAEMVSKLQPIEAKINSQISAEKTSNHQVFQTSLLYLQRRMEDALASLKLPKDFFIFIDGIDIRPNTVPFGEYLDCVKGLANAVWSLNNDFFSNIKDSKGRIKSIILLRPDIFNSLGLQNRNTKLKDNSVVLNWITDYSKHRSSELFYLADRIFSSQQKEFHAPGECWDNYFPFEAENLEYNRSNLTSFVVFLRYSYHRPRDILTMLDIVGEQFKKNTSRIGVFSHSDLFTSQFKETYGNYLLGEIRDSLSFYYDEAEFEIFLKFFEFLQGKKRFSYEEYIGSFEEFQKHIASTGSETPGFMKSPEEFLQFLYDQNVLNFIEYATDEQFIRWCFRERNTNNISPKVKLGMTYEIHYGLANTLNTGKPLSGKRTPSSEKKTSKKGGGKVETRANDGRIKFFDQKKGFGFIRAENYPLDIYFRTKDFEGSEQPTKGQKVFFEFARSRSDENKVQAVKVRIAKEK